MKLYVVVKNEAIDFQLTSKVCGIYKTIDEAIKKMNEIADIAKNEFINSFDEEELEYDFGETSCEVWVKYYYAENHFIVYINEVDFDI